MAKRNALAELAESMKRKVGDFSADESFKAALENANSPEEKKAAAFFREYALASRIVAELANVRCHAPFKEIQFAEDSMIAYRKCRAIAEEGAEDGANCILKNTCKASDGGEVTK